MSDGQPSNEFWKRFLRALEGLAKDGDVPVTRITCPVAIHSGDLADLRGIWTRAWPGRVCHLRAGEAEYELP